MMYYIEEKMKGLDPFEFVIFDGAGNLIAGAATRSLAEAVKDVLEARPCVYYG